MKVKISRYKTLAIVLSCIIVITGLIIVACVPEYSYKSKIGRASCRERV